MRETTFVSVEPEALVLSTNGGPIPGPCAGQLTGRFQHEYPPETSALRAPTFGRVARRNLARERVGAMVSP